MDDSWNASLLTGDQCAVCENPLGDDTEQIEQDGELLRVCGACAANRRDVTLATSDAASVLVEAELRSKAVQELLSCRADEQSQLEEIGRFMENLAHAVTHWQNSAAELEQRSRSLEAEVARLKERLRRAEDLMAAPPEQPEQLEQPLPEVSEPAIRRSAATPALHEEDLPSPHFPEPAPSVEVAASRFGVEELHLAQRFFNESPFTEKTRSVRRSLGRPIVNLTPVAGQRPQILVTIGWEIVWYQFLAVLDESLEPEERVSLFAEGMELHELSPAFKDSNANLDDEGRIDASELEFSLLDDRSEIIDDLSPEQVVLEDATEEIWDRHSAPEFRWDD